VATLRQAIQQRWRLWLGDHELQDLFLLGLFIAPLLVVIALNSILYDGWRQMYFVYPAFLLVTLRGCMVLWAACKWRGSMAFFVLALLISLSYSAVWMVKAHPFQNVYFNFLAGNNWKTRFEVDYWGLSNRRALEYILDHDSAPLVRVWPGSQTPVANSLLVMRPEQRARVQVVDREDEADYIVTNYRGNSTDYGLSNNANILFYRLAIGNETILSIYKRTGMVRQ